jgi:hypothetical protein
MNDKKIEKYKKIIEKPKPVYYTIELEAMIPAIVKYRVLANSPEEALILMAKSQPVQQPKLIMNSMKKIKASIFNYGTSILKYSKRF